MEECHVANVELSSVPSWSFQFVWLKYKWTGVILE